MANEFVARKGLIVSGSTTLSGSVEADGYISASEFSGSFFGDGSGLTNVTSEITGTTTFSEQFVSQSSVLITHNLSTLSPIVQVYDENDEQIIPTKIKIENDQQVSVEFPSEVSGKVVIAKGGHLFLENPAAQFSQDFTNETSITVLHLLDTISPFVQIYDEENEQVIPQKIKAIDSSSILVEFPTQTSGTIVVAKGGHIIDAANLSYVAQSFTNTSLVSVTHNFGTDAPIVQVYDNNGLQIIPQEIRIIDENSLEVEFPVNTSGKVAVSRGGHIIQADNVSFDQVVSLIDGQDITPSSVTSSFSGPLIGTASFATSASFAQTASFALNAGGNTFPFTGSAEISGSLRVTDRVGIGIAIPTERRIDVDGGEVRIGQSSAGTGAWLAVNLRNGTTAPAAARFALRSTASESETIPITQPNLILNRGSDGSGTLLKFTNQRTGFAGIGSAADANNLHDIRFYSGDGSERIRVNPSGSVGIGITSPSATLHVSGNVSASSVTSSFTVTEAILPSVTDQIDIGSEDLRFRDLYLSGSTIYLGNIKLSESEEGTLEIITADQNKVDIGVANNKIDNLEIESGSIRTELNNYTSSADNRLSSLETESGSIRTEFANFSSSIVTTIDELEVGGGGTTDITALNNFTSSADSRLNSLETESGSIRTTLNNYTSSADTRLGSLETESGSIRADFNGYTSSLNTAISLDGTNLLLNGNLFTSGNITASEISADVYKNELDQPIIQFFSSSISGSDFIEDGSYIVTASVPGLKQTDRPIVDIDLSEVDFNEIIPTQDNWALVYRVEASANDELKLYSIGEVFADFKLLIQVMR
jgi:hypothetical protein